MKSKIFINLLTIAIGLFGLLLGHNQYYGGVLLLVNHLIYSGIILQFVLWMVANVKKTKQEINRVCLIISVILFSSLIGILLATMVILNNTVYLIQDHNITIYIGFIVSICTILDIMIIVYISGSSKFNIRKYKK